MKRWNAGMKMKNEFPKYVILPDKVFVLSITRAKGGRAFDRMLVDYVIEGQNPLTPSDTWQTLIGMSREFSDDYKSYRLPVPLEWLLIRFLTHYVRTNSVHIISGPGGEVLKTSNFEEYLGREISDAEVDETLGIILGSFVRTLPNQPLTLGDLYGSTDISLNNLNRGVNYRKQLGHLTEISSNEIQINPSIGNVKGISPGLISLDRKINRYYQEIPIEAAEPFCFVIMPFREAEFPQRIYKEVIKPFVEKNFKISCYRVDEDHLPDRIDNKIYTYLLRAAFIIAEVTTCNPNVFYELGLAHMLEKDCIIITQKFPTEVPFDIGRIRAEKYGSDPELIDILRKAISALAFKVKR
jgi:hypothetical protein